MSFEGILYHDDKCRAHSLTIFFIQLSLNFALSAGRLLFLKNWKCQEILQLSGRNWPFVQVCQKKNLVRENYYNVCMVWVTDTDMITVKPLILANLNFGI